MDAMLLRQRAIERDFDRSGGWTSLAEGFKMLMGLPIPRMLRGDAIGFDRVGECQKDESTLSRACVLFRRGRAVARRCF
jgi:hypothetical protein